MTTDDQDNTPLPAGDDQVPAAPKRRARARKPAEQPATESVEAAASVAESSQDQPAAKPARAPRKPRVKAAVSEGLAASESVMPMATSVDVVPTVAQVEERTAVATPSAVREVASGEGGEGGEAVDE
jgi:hypothetical protein